MPSGEVLKLYESGRRGRPVPTIGPGDLSDPAARPFWPRVAAAWRVVVEIAREARELEQRALGGRYRGADW